MTTDYPLSHLFLRNRLRHVLNEQEKHRLEAILGEPRSLEDNEVLSHRGELCQKSTLLLEGFMFRTIQADGARHIVCIQVPGDFVDLHGFALRRLDHDIVAAGPARVANASHAELRRVMEELPRLTRILWFSTLLDAAIHREWILKMEQLNADGRLAHLFAELWHRLDFVGLAHPNGYDLPLRQIDLADTCGTTAIHMNRIIGQLRREGIVEFKRGRVTIPDRARLEEFAHFNPEYLYGPGKFQVNEGY